MKGLDQIIVSARREMDTYNAERKLDRALEKLPNCFQDMRARELPDYLEDILENLVFNSNDREMLAYKLATEVVEYINDHNTKTISIE